MFIPSAGAKDGTQHATWSRCLALHGSSSEWQLLLYMTASAQTLRRLERILLLAVFRLSAVQLITFV